MFGSESIATLRRAASNSELGISPTLRQFVPVRDEMVAQIVEIAHRSGTLYSHSVSATGQLDSAFWMRDHAEQNLKSAVALLGDPDSVIFKPGAESARLLRDIARAVEDGDQVFVGDGYDTFNFSAELRAQVGETMDRSAARASAQS